ncbi:hypothetical protein BaRGS_00008417, partial [Batillaria attramentaria]
FQVLEIHLNASESRKDLLTYLESKHQADVWGWTSHGAVDVMVGPTHVDDVIRMLKTKQVSHRTKIEDVQRLLDEHVAENRHPRHRRAVSLSSVTRRYLRLPQIRQFLQNVRANATQADVTLSSLGRTFQGRTTPYVRIRQKNSGDTNRSVIIVDAGIHAREWIAPAMALNIIHRLAFNPNDDPEVEDLLEKFDWLIIPVLNPDGYVYSHANSSTRLWRKTRTTAYSRDPYCLGVDANRNFGYEWSDSPEHGGNSNPCTDNYSGPSGFSEPETRNLKALLDRERGRTAAYLSLHSYGQFFLYPWGYDASARIDDESDLAEVARQFSDAMWRRNRWYEVGSSAKVLYAAAGASDDYARGGAGVKYAFTVELSPTDSSPHGFLLPAHHISSVVADHWPAFKAMARAIWNKMQDDSSNADSAPEFSSTQDEIEDEQLQHDQEDDPTRAAASGRNDNSFRVVGSGAFSNGLTSVTIDGHTYQLNLSDPVTLSWVQYYMDLFGYERPWDTL